MVLNKLSTTKTKLNGRDSYWQILTIKICTYIRDVICFSHFYKTYLVDIFFSAILQRQEYFKCNLVESFPISVPRTFGSCSGFGMRQWPMHFHSRERVFISSWYRYKPSSDCGGYWIVYQIEMWERQISVRRSCIILSLYFYPYNSEHHFQFQKNYMMA